VMTSMTVSSTITMESSIGTSSACLRNSGLLPLHRAPLLASLPFPRAVSSSSSSPPPLTHQEKAVDQQNEQQELRQQRRANGTPAFIKLEPMKKQQLQQQRKWSRGDAPGEYGGPPLDTRIRTSWGGNSNTDPLTESGDYIWKKNWQPFVESPPSDVADVASTVAVNAKVPDSGFLSLNRAIALGSMDIDLTEELMKPSKATLQRQVEEARRFDLAAGQKNQSEKVRWRLAPTRREEELWAKGRKAATGGSEVMTREINKSRIDPTVEAERQRLWYLELKRRLQLFTLALGGLGTTSAYLTYSPAIAGSYGVGLLGALVYVRMLGTSVDGLGAQNTAGAAR
jgi:hypothetical protein